MSLDSCRPLSPLSLSLTSLLSRPVLIQGSIVGSPDPHSHLRVGRGFIYLGGLSRREGSLHYLFIGVLSAGVHDIGWRQAPDDACWHRHRARSLDWLVGTVSGPYSFGLIRPHDGLQGVGGTSVVRSDVGRESSAWTILCP